MSLRCRVHSMWVSSSSDVLGGFTMQLSRENKRLTFFPLLPAVFPLATADCHFSHPPKSTQTFNRSKFSATFNNPNKSGGGTDSTTTTTKTAAAIGDWPKEKPEHVSERLKRFSTQGNDGEAAEKIIPGQPQAANGREKKVEIHLDDEDEHKEKKEQAKA